MSLSEHFSPHYKSYYPGTRLEWGYDSLVRDTHGNTYIDATSGWGVLAFGHCFSEIQKAAIDQIENLIHTCGCNFDHTPQNVLARELIKKMPGGYDWGLFFANSGAESVEGAMKLARYHTKRSGFIAFRGGFHGRTFGAMSLGSAFPKLREGFEPLLSGVKILPYNDVDEIRGQWLNIAAVFVEPVQGVGGCKVASKEFMKAIRDFCNENGALMVVDEVQSGIGRTGKFWAFEHSAVVPDIICSAKALGGGFPLGAVIARKEIMTWPPGSHGSTFGGHPVACMTGAVVLRKINEAFLKRVGERSHLFRQELESIRNCKVDGLGFMLAIDVFDSFRRDRIMERCKKNGLLVLPAEPHGIRLLPALNCKTRVLKEIVDILRKVIN